MSNETKTNRTQLKDLPMTEQEINQQAMKQVKGGKDFPDGPGAPPKPENNLCSARYCSKTSGHPGPHGKDTTL